MPRDFIVWVVMPILVLFGLMLLILKSAGDRQCELMRQCVADGHKEYECVGILRGRR